MPDIILTEHPLTERMRLMLRLEHLFDALDPYRKMADPWGSRMLVLALLDIRELVSRADVKLELGKELGRHAKQLEAMRGQAQVDQTRLEDVLSELERAKVALLASQSEGKKLFRNDAMLAVVEQRHSVPGGTCSFDVPAFHQWLHGDPDARKTALVEWLGAVQPLRHAISLSLRLSRASAQAQTQVAKEGFYQQSLPANKTLQLIRIAFNANEAVYPEVSGDTHRFSVRYLQASGQQAGQPTDHDIPFQLTCCLL